MFESLRCFATRRVLQGVLQHLALTNTPVSRKVIHDHCMVRIANSPRIGDFIPVIQRAIETAIRYALEDTPVVLLNGARQTGKTTLAKALFDPSAGSYFTFDDATTLGLATSDPTGFIRQLSGPVVLDEIQRIPSLFTAIKLAVDQDRQPGRFLLTGSANVLSLPRLADSLAGRMEILPLYPFSAGELNGVPDPFLPRLFGGGWKAGRSLTQESDLLGRLVQGGYPEAVARDDAKRRAVWFASYISTLLQRDVRDLARVEALHALPNLLKLLAARTSGLLNLADVGRDAGMPHTTLTRYLALLEAIFLIHRLPAWSPNLGQRLVKAAKLHVVDTGLACHLVGADERRLTEDRTLLGRMLETFVVGELRKQISWAGPQMSLHHFRSAVGTEVDIIIEKPDGSVTAIEVKASATVGTPDLAGLRFLRDALGKRFVAGVVLYLGEKIIPADECLMVVPVSALWSQ